MPTKSQNRHHATRDSRLEPVSSTFPPTFRPRFAHLSPTFRNGSFSVSGVYVGLVLGTIPCNLRRAHNSTIQATLGTAAWTSGSLKAYNPGIYSISGSRSCVVLNAQKSLELAAFGGSCIHGIQEVVAASSRKYLKKCTLTSKLSCTV